LLLEAFLECFPRFLLLLINFATATTLLLLPAIVHLLDSVVKILTLSQLLRFENAKRLMKTPKKPSYAKGGSLKPVQPGQSGLAKLPVEVRNKMGYMMGGGKLGMMYKNGGKTPIVPDPKKGTGTFMSFKNGRVGRTTPSFEFAGRPVVSYESMDTTGLAKGKENFVLTKSQAGQQTKSTINRKDVPAKIAEMKKGATKSVKFQNGGMMGGKKKQDPPRKITDVLDRNGRVISPERRKLEAAFEANKTKNAEATFNRNARAAEARNLTEMRNALKAEGPAEVAKFDKELKARGYKVVARPVKKMAQGGVMKNTKDNNSYISNAVDMSSSTKKQMEALRQAMMYFTGVSPKNK
jgi:hypothetical protein